MNATCQLLTPPQCKSSTPLQAAEKVGEFDLRLVGCMVDGSVIVLENEKVMSASVRGIGSATVRENEKVR